MNIDRESLKDLADWLTETILHLDSGDICDRNTLYEKLEESCLEWYSECKTEEAAEKFYKDFNPEENFEDEY